MMNLTVDYRETAVIGALAAKHATANLEVGDFHLTDAETGETVLVIERKTVADLCASIRDGRAREQKARLLGSFPAEKIMYVIEGSLTRFFQTNITPDTVLSSIVNTQFRDGIRVHRTENVRETAAYLEKLLKKLPVVSGASKGSYASTLCTQKKGNMTPEVWFEVQLATIPGVSPAIARCIRGVYSGLGSLLRAYADADDSLRPLLLQDIRVSEKRRLGPALSRRIHAFYSS